MKHQVQITFDNKLKIIQKKKYRSSEEKIFRTWKKFNDRRKTVSQLQDECRCNFADMQFYMLFIPRTK